MALIEHGVEPSDALPHCDMFSLDGRTDSNDISLTVYIICSKTNKFRQVYALGDQLFWRDVHFNDRIDGSHPLTYKSKESAEFAASMIDADSVLDYQEM